MGLFDGQNSIQAFEDLLERERRMILSGDFDSVGRLAAEKERLLKRLSRLTLKRDKLARLRRQAERNQHLLEASARGFRAVQDRLRAMNDAASKLGTYDANGQRQSFGKPGSSGFNKRA